MTLESDVRECSSGLTAVRATDRKKSAESLKDFLTRNAVPSLLSDNTRKKNGYTWSDLFDDINEFVLKETEKFETSKNFETVIGPLCASLLHLCVSGSNKGQAYIKCDKILDASLFILKDNRLSKAIGDAYLNILYKHVLNNDHLLQFITPTAWEELLEVSLTICLTKHCKLDDFTKMRLVWLVVKNGRNYCQIIIPLRTALPKFMKCFYAAVGDKKVQEVVIEIMTLLLDMLSSECRLTMCEFVESSLASLLQFYDQNFDYKKKASFFKLLRMTIILHHPRGRKQNEEGSLANNWSVWNKHLNSILEVISLELIFIQKRKQNEFSIKNCKDYCSLTASVFYQIFSLSAEQDVEKENVNFSKRQKLSINKIKNFSDIIEELKQNHVPWLAITHMYIKQYGKFSTTTDILLLVSVIESLIARNDILDWDIFQETTCTLIKILISRDSSANGEFNDVLNNLWNSCLRTSTLANASHKALHTIMQQVLTAYTLRYQNVQPLCKLYFEKGMPVTDDSLRTLNHVVHIFFSKCSHFDERSKLFNWLTQGQITSLNVENVREFLLRLLANENVNYLPNCDPSESDFLLDILFKSVDDCILFSEFEIETSEPLNTEEQKVQTIEVNVDINKNIMQYFVDSITEHTDKLKKKEAELQEYIKLINITLAYLDILLKYNFVSLQQIRREHIFRLVKVALRLMYLSLTNCLESNITVMDKIKLLRYVQDTMTIKYDPTLNSEVRGCINEEFFHCVNSILNAKLSTDDEGMYEGDDSEIDPNILRHHCIILLAVYCAKRESYRDEILELILDPKIYNFSNSWDIDCAIECIGRMCSSKVEDPPLELIFTLLQHMCKDLFRNSKASFKILNTMLKMLEQIWSENNKTKHNCFIMVKSYLQRCEKLYYPPHLAALIYKCAAKITILNFKDNQNSDTTFIEALINKIKGDIYNIRLYCCYLLKDVYVHLSDSFLESYLAGLMDIFVIKVSERRATIIKDESANRTLTILHSFFALAQTKNLLIHTIVCNILQIQKDKSLDQKIVKKFLNKITNVVVNKNIESYLKENILSVVNHWLSKSNELNDLPLFLFGYEQMDEFIEGQMHWLIAAEILWQKKGIVNDSEVLKHVRIKTGKSVENIIEACICNITVLSLPYVVIEKYQLSYHAPGKWEWSEHAAKMFESARQVLGVGKWSSLFVENMSELVLLIAVHLSDHTSATQYFQVDIPRETNSYHYPKEVFDAILKYIEELIEENIIKYLCQNQALAIFKTLFKLWEKVLDEKVFEFKVRSLHTYITFFDSIPLGYPSDAFVCIFSCNNLAHAIKSSQSKDEIKVFIKTLKSVLERILLEKVDGLQQCVTHIVSILMIKKDEGFESQCSSLLEFVVTDMKDYMKESEDVIDFVSSMSQSSAVSDGANCTSKYEFLQKLKSYRKNLSSPYFSRESLTKMQLFLKANSRYVCYLSEALNAKGFSDDCGTSEIHQIIYALCNILKSASDEKTIMEVCNCLSEIGNYDLKTLVTVPPVNTQRLTDISPRQYFAIVVMTSLSEILFDENPLVTNGVSKSLKRLLQYREGEIALELEEDTKKLLLPFSTPNPNEFAEFKMNDVKFNAVLTTALLVSGDETHSAWVTRVTVAFLDLLISSSNYLNTLKAACLMKSSLCPKILPPLMGLLLECSSERHVKVIAEQINQFFIRIWDATFDEIVENSEDSTTNKKTSNALTHDHKVIVQYMLDVVNFVRLQREHYKTRPTSTIESLNYLRLEYDKVAWAATVADRNLAAIFYGELWAVANNSGVPPASPEATRQLSGGENVQRIFRKCFVSIGELDAIDGCGTAHLTSEEEKRKHLINTGQFADALLLHDIALSNGGQIDPHLQYGVVKSLHKSGMHHLALQYIKSLPENDDLNDIKYECLSFLGDWSDFVDTRDLEEKSRQTHCKPHSIIKAFRYSCLKDCLNLQTNPDFERKLVLPLCRAKLAVAKLTQNLNMENCQSVYKVLGKLHLFRDIEDYFSVRSSKSTIQELLNKWQVEKLPAFKDFKHLEVLISQRCMVLEHAAKAYTPSLRDIVSLQLQYAELGLSNQRVQMAQRLLAVVKKLQNSQEVALTDSQISWAKGHREIALSLLYNIVSNPTPDVRLTAISLRQYGMWMAESKCDNARDIINKYLKKSLQVLRGNDHEETRLKVYYDIAKFADAEYKQVVAYMSSSIFENKVKCAENMKDTASCFRSTQEPLNKDEKKAMFTNDRFVKIDEAELASTRAEKDSFLHLAMRYYLLCLKQGEMNNLLVFRVISLWLDNPNLQLTESEGDTFEELLHAIPSRKYVTVLPQLVPRLTNETSTFANNLKKIIKRCAVEHPHHTLPILFNLKNSDKDKQILNASKNVGSSHNRSRSQEPRVAAADALISQLAEETGLAVIILQMEKICDATISFANYVPKPKESRQKIPPTERIHRLGHLDAIPVPTVTIPVSYNSNYSYLPTLVSFENYFELVGGINCPKKITCKSSDGKTRILLIKGEDDLRQDAVMQQVFNIVNTLLENDPVTSRNKLLIRTYKVVPMSRRSGVLEWCEGTMPIGIYLIGSSGAHSRYRPQDISPSAARAALAPLNEMRKSNAEKLAVFLKILKQFRPVFHYFFTENFLDPVTWYERRLAYTKSVATSSMVGYILGLGDRHLQNILIDKKTAEVVHIDFGIAFDQGKTLPTPETIPFRLTQDIVAGFGSSGVEGIFRKCCEKTMQLLRDNQETLLTILEVLLCDPLYSWTVTSKQQNVLTAPSKDTSVNVGSNDGSLAKRALLTVSSKLSGIEGGVAGGVAVPGQVARLIHTAMDPANLSRLYHGWQPYL